MTNRLDNVAHDHGFDPPKVGLNHPVALRAPWANESVVDRLKELWPDHPPSQIAKQLSAEFSIHFTRNSIVGKAFRLGLTAKDKSEDGKWAIRPSRPKLKIVANGQGLTLLETIESSIPKLRVIPDEPLNLTLDQVVDVDGCRYIAGSDHLFCGHVKRKGSSFCASHHSIVWIPPTQRNERARGVWR